MDRKTQGVLAALAVILPLAWGAGSKLIELHEKWSKVNLRIERLERARCAYQVTPPDWSRKWPVTQTTP